MVTGASRQQLARLADVERIAEERDLSREVAKELMADRDGWKARAVRAEAELVAGLKVGPVIICTECHHPVRVFAWPEHFHDHVLLRGAHGAT